MDILKAGVKNFTNPLDKYCLLMFDEMSLSPALTWSSFDGNVEGFEDFGFKCTSKIANQVCMLRGISRKWKQPVFYNFVHGGTNHSDITRILKLIIKKCSEIGLQVVAAVCDQGRNNEAAIKNLVWETKRKYLLQGQEYNQFTFEVGNEFVVPLFYVPHLMKGLRNNLLKADLSFKMNGESTMGKWKDILIAHQLDPYLGSLRTMPKFTEQHVNPLRIDKMKVSFCTQVFSRSVAVGLNVLAYSGTTFVDANGIKVKLERRTQETA